MAKNWIITGASSGLGAAFATAALERGDRVVGISRSIGSDFAGVAIPADVTDRDAVFAAFATAKEQLGTVDVVVNGAGIMSSGFVEEFTEAEAREALETNFFGALWVTQAAAGILRAQNSGHLVQVSSIGGVLGYLSTGLYSASKFALEGLSEAVAAELEPFGVTVTILEPGGYWTALYDNVLTAAPLEAYADAHAELEAQFAEGSADSRPELAASALLTIVDTDAPPRRLILGDTVFDYAVAATEQRVATWREWETVSRRAEDAVPDPR